MTTTIRDVLHHKGHDVWAVPATATVREAVDGMNEHHIGSVLVARSDGQVVGIFTERDVLVRVVAAGEDPGSTRVSDVMTTDVARVAPEDEIYDVLRLMTKTRHRHMPVFEHGELLGMVSIGDLTDCALREMDGEVIDLTQYIYGPSVQPRENERAWLYSRARA